MSKWTGLPYDVESVRKYIDSISKIPYVKEIYLVGSRSPNSNNEHRETSDWDLIINSDVRFSIQNPRINNLLHIDCVVSLDMSAYPDRYEIWPTDKKGILK